MNRPEQPVTFSLCGRFFRSRRRYRIGRAGGQETAALEWQPGWFRFRKVGRDCRLHRYSRWPCGWGASSFATARGAAQGDVEFTHERNEHGQQGETKDADEDEEGDHRIGRLLRPGLGDTTID